MRELQCDVSNIRLNWAVTETAGAPLVMLHGVTRRWQTFLPVMQALSLRWNVHALDFRGHGQSGRAAGQYTVADYVPDVVDFVQRQFTVPVVLYGHSLGAMVAAAAAARLGSQARAVVLEDPPWHAMGERIAASMLLSFFAGLAAFAGDTRPVPQLAAALARVRLSDPQQQRTLLLGDIRDATALRFTAASLKQVDPAVFEPILSGHWLVGLDPEHIHRQLLCPVLLLQADEAAGGMLSDADAAACRQWTPDLTHVRLAGVGHVIHVGQTAALVNHVSGFLESLT